MRILKNLPLTITFTTAILGMMLGLQFNTQKQEIKNANDISQIRQELQKEIERNQNLKAEITRQEQVLDKYEASLKQGSSVKVMDNELDRLKEKGGITPITGEGVIITISDLPSSDGKPSINDVYDEDLRNIINELLGAGAKALSINGHRIVPTTYIRNVGESIFIDTKVIKPPYQILAVGKADLLDSTIKLKGMQEYFKVLNKELKVQKMTQLTAPAFNGNVEITFLKPLKDNP